MKYRRAVQNDEVRAFRLYSLGEFPRTHDGKRALVSIFYQTLNGVPVRGMDETRVHRVAERLYSHSLKLIRSLKDIERVALETLMRARLRLDVLRGGEATDDLLVKVESDLERAAIQLENSDRPSLLSEYDRLHSMYNRIQEALEKRRQLVVGL